MSHFATPAAKEQFTNDVLNHLAVCKAHQRTGNRDGEQSLSYLVTVLREKGWRLTTSGWGTTAQELLEEAGFTLRQQRNGRAVRTYVGI